MTKKRRSSLQLEQPQFFKVAEITSDPADNNELDMEIQCPSCQSIMTLYSVSDSPYYGCIAGKNDEDVVFSEIGNKTTNNSSILGSFGQATLLIDAGCSPWDPRR